MADALDTVAKQFPDVNFAIIDFAQEEMKSKPANVRGLLFKEQEAGYLVGYLAGLLMKQEAGSQQVIGSVGGLKIPPVDRYIAGYRAGARAANPKIKTLNAYSQDFVDQAKCKEVALDQIAAAPTSSSRSRASAASARSPRRRRRTCAASVSTPTRHTSARTC